MVCSSIGLATRRSLIAAYLVLGSGPARATVLSFQNVLGGGSGVQRMLSFLAGSLQQITMAIKSNYCEKLSFTMPTSSVALHMRLECF